MKDVTCGVCGLPIESDEEASIHDHIPDFFLSVWSCQAYLCLSRGGRVEELPFQMPDRWVSFVLESSGGSITTSGIYRLPGLMWEWVIAMCRGDEKGARHIARAVEEFLDRCGWEVEHRQR